MTYIISSDVLCCDLQSQHIILVLGRCVHISARLLCFPFKDKVGTVANEMYLKNKNRLSFFSFLSLHQLYHQAAPQSRSSKNPLAEKQLLGDAASHPHDDVLYPLWKCGMCTLHRSHTFLTKAAESPDAGLYGGCGGGWGLLGPPTPL